MLALLIVPSIGFAQGTASTPPMESLTFEQAVDRAIRNNPSVTQAAAGILRAEAILQQVRAGTLPAIDANVSSTTIDPVPGFGGAAVTPRTQLNSSVALAVPIITPTRWAQRNQAGDQILVAQRGADEARRQIALATAQSYLQILAARRVVDLNERARDTARAHFDYARQRFEGGVGSRLNLLRAQQELSGDETRVEAARLFVRRAQEALGVLVASDGPVDAAGEPAFELPPDETGSQWLTRRADIQLVTARQSAAERVVRDSWRDRLPSVIGLFDPQVVYPKGLFQPTRSWRASVVFSVPLFDSGQRTGLARERRALLDVVRLDRTNLERTAKSELRTAWEAVRSTERALASARAAADQAEEVVRITDVAFRAGATTNIEVIDAQRRARDAETEAVIAEDAVRRARLELLVAVGAFP